MRVSARNVPGRKPGVNMNFAPARMHIPDGFLSPGVALICWLVSIGLIGLAVKQATRNFEEKQIPLMGVMAAFIFAAQMINFPVAGGTSGHLLGATLATFLLGPWAGMLIMTSVVIVQGLLFQDGGLLAMGANLLNMAFLTVFISMGILNIRRKPGWKTRLVLVGLAAWLSVLGGALATTLQLWLSGTARLAMLLPAMLGVHAVIGVGEALISMACLAFLFRTRPDLLEAGQTTPFQPGWAIAGLGLSLLVIILAPWASIYPDGLERVAMKLGFSGQATVPNHSFFTDYQVGWLGGSPLSVILAGTIGLLVVAGLAWLMAALIRKKKS